jgi:hypothetical protein
MASTGSDGHSSFPLGSIVELRSRLWRVDDLQGDVLIATSIDGTPVERRKFYLPFEKVRQGRIEPPSSDIVGNFSAQDLLLRAYRLSMIHGAAPLLSLVSDGSCCYVFGDASGSFAYCG